jgi:hypothetical protein
VRISFDSSAPSCACNAPSSADASTSAPAAAAAATVVAVVVVFGFGAAAPGGVSSSNDNNIFATGGSRKCLNTAAISSAFAANAMKMSRRAARPESVLIICGCVVNESV